jgi:hypothetical protein
MSGKQVLLVEDVVTSGGRIRSSAADLRKLGATISHALCVIDRDAGGAENLAGNDRNLAFRHRGFPPNLNMQRVIVIGCSGSGKSTLARELASQTGLPRIHLDQEYCLPGWKEPGKDEWQARVEQLTQRTAWIIEAILALRSGFGLRRPTRSYSITIDS